MELTDDIVLNLSKRITDERDLKTLGNCLGLPCHEIDSARANNQDITMATHQMLQKWYRKNEDPFEAWNKLAEALKRAGLNIYVAQVLKK